MKLSRTVSKVGTIVKVNERDYLIDEIVQYSVKGG